MKTGRIILVGNPNAGKSTLFNALSGLRAKTANYAGVTVEQRAAIIELKGQQVELVDTPGMYSLVPRADDEDIAVSSVLSALSGVSTTVVVVVDACQLQRNLQLVAQLREWPLRLVMAVTMLDVVEADGEAMHLDALARNIGIPVYDSRTLSHHLPDLLGVAVVAPVNPPRTSMTVPDGAAEAWLKAWQIPSSSLPAARLWLGQAELVVRDEQRASLRMSSQPMVSANSEPAAQLVQARYQRAQQWTEGTRSVVKPHVGQTRSARITAAIDAVLLHPLVGMVVMIGLFAVVLQALFSWSAPLMDGIEAIVGQIGVAVVSSMPATMPLLTSLLRDGIIAGVGNVVVFVPQVAMLFLFIGILEDSGYLARAAFLLDRIMAGVGLHGRAFVPMLSGFACAVPAIMATRSIESQRDRLVTILVTPFISCSARLPVYSLIIATVFSSTPPLWGVVPVGVAIMMAMYGLSITAALVAAAILKRTVLRSPSPPLILELPAYRMPRMGSLLRAVASRVKSFLVDAGTIILAITVVLWALFQFPRDDVTEGRIAATIAELERTPASNSRDDAIDRARGESARLRIEHSIAGRVGLAIEPALQPLGFDWRIGIGLMASFAAREVMVSTLGLVYGLGDGADEESTSLRERMGSATRADGTPLYTPLTGLSLLVFFVLAMQCMSTLAAVKRETGGWRWPLLQLAAMTIAAYLASLLVYQGGRLLGWS